MTKVSNKNAYSIKKPIAKDYFVGSDSEQFGKTVNFDFEETAYLINKLNGSLIVNYLFKVDNNINLEVLTEGVFLSEDNETEISSITKLYINKKNFSGDDLSELYTFLKVNKNSFFFKLQNSEDLKNACYFNISNVVDHTDYFIFDINVFLQNQALQSLIHFNVYFFSFDIKSAAGNGNEDKFTSVGTISLVDNEITISTGFEWEINSGEFANVVPFIETIPFSSTGNQRFVLFVANAFDTFEMISGPESISNPVAPPVPENTIQLTLLLVTDGVIGNPTLPDLSDYATINYVDSHSNRTDNPHNVTKSQIGLGNVDNTSDANKPVSTAQASADAAVLSSANAYTDAGLAGKEDKSNKTGTVIGNEASTSLYLHIAGQIAYFQQKLTDVIFGAFQSVLPTVTTVADTDKVPFLIGSLSRMMTWASFKALFKTINSNSIFGSGNIVTPDMDTTTPQNVQGVKTFLTGMFGLRNVANTFTSFFTNSNTSSRTYTLQNKNGTIAHLDDIISQLSGTVNYLVKFGTATTGVVSRLFDNGTFFGIGTVNTPTKDITLGNQSNKEIGVENSNNTTSGRELSISAGKTINYVESSTFIALSQTPLAYWSMTYHPNGNIYVNAGTGLYLRAGGTGNFNSIIGAPPYTYGLGLSTAGDVYAAKDGGDIYKQTGGTGSFVALGQTSRAWRGIGSNLSGDVYACVTSGDIYKQTGGTGAFVALGVGNALWADMIGHPNGDVYACVTNGDIYKQTGGTGSFVALGQTSRSWYGITATPSGDVYACVLNGDIYKQTGGIGAFVALGQTSRAWRGITTDLYGNVYASVNAGDIYILINYGLGTPDIDGGTLKLKAGTGKGSGKSVVQIVTGQKSGIGTNMQIETVRAEYDEAGNYKRIGTPVYADNTAALAGGLTAGMEYRTSAGVKMEVY